MINPFLDIQDGHAEAKHQCMLENKVKIITSSEYQKFLDFVDEKYGKNYLDSFKKNKNNKS